MNLFHLSLWIGAQAVALRLSFLCGIWESRELRRWDEFCDTARSQREPMSLRAFVRARLAAWCATVCWGYSPWLSWRERVALMWVWCCVLLLTLGVRVPLIVLGLEQMAGLRWSDWPEGKAPPRQWRCLLWVVNWPARQEQRLTALVGQEAVLRRATLASLYPAVDAVPEVAQPGKLVPSEQRR